MIGSGASSNDDASFNKFQIPIKGESLEPLSNNTIESVFKNEKKDNNVIVIEIGDKYKNFFLNSTLN